MNGADSDAVSKDDEGDPVAGCDGHSAAMSTAADDVSTALGCGMLCSGASVSPRRRVAGSSWGAAIDGVTGSVTVGNAVGPACELVVDTGAPPVVGRRRSGAGGWRCVVVLAT